MQYKIDIITSGSKFRELEEEWTLLLRNSQAGNPFLSWEWMYTWWEIYGQNAELCIVAVRHPAGRLLGLAPFKIVSSGVPGFGRLNRLEFIGTGGDVTSEYLDIIVERNYEKEVTYAILERLFQDKLWARSDLRNFATDSYASYYIKEWLRERSLAYREKIYTVCPVAALPESMEAFFAGKSANFRKKMKEYVRVANRDLAVRFDHVSRPEDLDAGMRRLKNLHRARWGKKSRAFASRQYVAFHERLSRLFLEKGWLRLFFLRDGQTDVAGIYCFAYDNVYYYYQSGRNLAYSKYRPGFVLLARTIQEAIDEGAAEFDFLTGEEEYKLRWANRLRETGRLSVRNPRMPRNPILYLNEYLSARFPKKHNYLMVYP